MRGVLAILAGFVLGVVAAGMLLGGIVAFAPDPAPPATPEPSVAVVLPTATPSAVPSQSAATSASAGASATGATPFHVGERAPALSVPQVGGGTIDLANLKGQPVWIDFMTTKCTTCKDEFPLMTSYANRYAANGLVVIAVDVGEDEGTADTFADGLGATFPLGLDADGSGRKDVGAPWRCRSTSGSTRTGSSATQRRAGSVPTP
jgi:thiol-disulfide isomerase/thioredoxin